jgi:hypothetical protein
VIRAYFSARLNADIDRVWAVVGDFQGVARWVWSVDTCIVRGGQAPHEVGAIREYTMRDGLTQQERLVAYDAVGHSYSYEFVGAVPFGMSYYQGTVHLCPIVEDGTTFVEWIGEFDAEAGVRDNVKIRFERLYAAVTGDLRYHLARPQTPPVGANPAVS